MSIRRHGILGRFKRARLVALIAAIALLAACGQKPGVHETASGLTAAGTGDTSGLGGSTDGPTTGGSATVGGTSTGGGTTSGGTGGGGTAGGGGTTAGGGGGAAAPSGPADRTGVTDKEIIIGIHAPVTGAAPFPADAFANGRDIYWTWSGAPKVGGRTVKVLFEDDQYNPTTARDRCRKMAEQQKAFLLVGGGGTDQIQSCAQYAQTGGIPYLSAGVTEIGVNTLPNYFALSMSYKQQGELLWQMIEKDSRLSANGGTGKVGMIRTDTPNFDDAHQAFLAGAQKRGKKLVLDRTMPKNPSQTDYNTMAGAIASAGVQNLYILVAPTHYVQLTARMTTSPYFIGAGITKGLNAVLETGCNTSQNKIGKALFFSPFPGVDKIDSLDPNYKKAYRERNDGAEPDDLGIALWGLNKTLHEMFKAAGENLSRQSFISSASTGTFKSGVFPDLKFTANSHFGANQVHVLKADCAKKQYVTEKTFVSKF